MERNRTNQLKQDNEFEEIKEVVSNSLISSISKALKKLVIKSKYINVSVNKLNPFNSCNIPKISIEKYLKRIINYSRIEQPTLIVSLIYIDRLCSLSNIVITFKNVHKILFISIYISVKYNEDVHFNLDYFSKIAGMNLEEIIMLEFEFLRNVQFKLFVDEKVFEKYHKLLIQ